MPVVGRGAEVDELIGARTKGTPTEVDVPFCLPDRVSRAAAARPSELSPYLQAGSPSPAPVTIEFVVFTPMPHVKFGICECVTVADQ